MKIRTKRTIRKKVALLVLAVSLSTVLLMGLAAALGLVSIRGDTMASLDEINGRTAEDATAALRSQAQSELVTLVENKSSLADTSLSLILNQTRLVAMAAEEIYSNPEVYLAGVDPDNPPLDAYDFSCNYGEGVLGSFSYHLRAPRGVLTNIVEDGHGTVLSADLDAGALTPEQRRELYLASFLKTALGGIRNFDNGDGTYTGIGATYFCLASSGIDILADTLTMDMVEYDARGSEWYIEAANLGPGEVYWTDPLQDASGRGASLICAMPVYVDGELIGVAGSGGDIDNIREIVQSTTIGESGYAMLVSRRRPGEVNVIASANPDAGSELGGSGNLMLTPNAALARALTATNRGESGVTELPIDGESVYLACHPLETTDWSMVTVISLDDATITEPIEQLRGNIDAVTADTGEDMGARLTLLMLLFAAIALAAAIVVVAASWKFSARLTRPLTELTEGVRRISGGDLDFKLEVSSGDETAVLGDAFNHMTSSLRAYIDNLARVTAEKERIGAELHVATQIQSSMLPCIFPAFPERGEFDVYASMTPAKEVGGDFYDFFLVDEDHLALVIADVSGKGVPAALFMVIAKTLLKNRAQMGASPKEILETVNNQLCENNDAEMFVTVWLGVYEISTGRVTAANAGHEYPAIRRKGGKFELFRDKHGFVLAGMENMRYREYEFTLEPGDELFVYTDGVTEATDASSALYGTERMLAALDGCASDSPEALLRGVKADIDAFVGGAPQFDDITMLCLKRSEGGDGVKEITLEASVENIAAVTEFADGVLEGLGCPAKARAQLDVAIDELFSNIARYAYAPGTGSVTVRVEALEGPRAVELTFIDSGVPYDPLAREDPNTGLPLEEREAGGLGIFIVKKTMDAMSYEYANGQNILRAARSYGLEASGWRYEPESLREEGSFPCIVHWNFNHFIVLDGFKGDKVYVNDPARGSCVMSFEEFDRGFTGICLAFEPGEGFTPGGKPKSVFAYAAARLRGAGAAVAFVTLTTVISALIGIINPAFSRVFLDRLLTGLNPDWFMPFIIALTALGVVQIAVAWVQAVYSLKINGKLAALGSTEFMWKVLRLPMEFFAQRVAGDIQSRKDTNAGIANTIVNTLAPLALNMAMMVFYLAVMLRYSPMLTLVGITGIVVNLLVSRLISKKRIDIARLQTRDAGRLAGATVSGIEMIETIKSAGAENGWFERWAGYQASVNTQEARFSRLNNYLGLVPKIAASAANTVVLMLGVWLTVQGEFTAGMIMAFQGFLASFTAPAAQLITSGQTIQEMRTQMEQVEDVLSYRTDPNWRDDPVAEGTEYDKLSGAVELRHVTFGYSRLAEPLIEDFSLSLRPGSRVALVGASGCGKSTMAKLVSGLYEPWSGEILFDGRPIKEIDRSVFTGSLAVVDQDIILFEDTVSANVKMWDSSIEDFEVILAARDAEIHETVMQRDGGYNAHVSEGGRDFSGGERQRLEIARVLAQDPTIVILDEALASVTGGAGKRGGGHVLCPYCMSELVSLRGIHAHYGVEYFCPGCGERFAGYNDQMVRRQIEYARRLTHTLGASAAKEQLKESKNGVKDLL